MTGLEVMRRIQDLELLFREGVDSPAVPERLKERYEICGGERLTAEKKRLERLLELSELIRDVEHLEALEELRDQLANAGFGVTLMGHHLTIRYTTERSGTEDDLVQVCTVITGVMVPSDCEEKQGYGG